MMAYKAARPPSGRAAQSLYFHKDRSRGPPTQERRCPKSAFISCKLPLAGAVGPDDVLPLPSADLQLRKRSRLSLVVRACLGLPAGMVRRALAESAKGCS